MKLPAVKSILLNVVVPAAISAIVAHLSAEAIRTRRERLWRYAAGESDYERTHPRSSVKHPIPKK